MCFLQTKKGLRKVYPTNTRHPDRTASREENHCVNEREDQSRPMCTYDRHRYRCVLS